MRRHCARLLQIMLTASFMQVAIAAAIAGPYEDAKLAEEKGDYATALRLYRPLAEQGNTLALGTLLPAELFVIDAWSGTFNSVASVLMSVGSYD
jgi:hypothetical protein